MIHFSRLIALFLVLLPTAQVLGQTDDPCLGILAGDKEALQRYDALVGEYLAARDEENPPAQIRALDELATICDANLRIRVFRADALVADGQCEEAANEYLAVLDAAKSWPHPDNAADATARADEGLATVRASCVATVQVNCADGDAEVSIGDRPPQQCPATVDIAAGNYDVTVASPGRKPLVREYTFRQGNNFVEIEQLALLERPGQVEFKCADPGTMIVVGPESFGCPALRTYEAGSLSYVAKRADGISTQGTVAVVENQTVTVEVEGTGGAAAATGDMGSLDVSCEPAREARAYISGPSFPSAVEQDCPFSIPVAPGDYTLQFTAGSREPQERQVNVAPGETVRLNVSLADGEESGGIGIALRALGGITSPFVSDSRDDPGIQGALKAALNIPFRSDASSFEIGAFARMGIAEEFGVFGGAYLGYLFPISQSLDLSIGGSLGYGTGGIQNADGNDDAAVYYSIYTTLSLRFGMLELVLTPEIYIGGPALLLDVVAGAGIVF